VESVPEMIFTKPPMFPESVNFLSKKMPTAKKISIEGKWRFISKHVKHLIADGWKQVSIEANQEFTLTVVELER